MAVTIDAPPHRVWPWLAQMGYDRGGWYSWDHLDNGGRPSADRIHSEWQRLELGDWLTAWSPMGPVDSWEVAALEPGRFLGLRGRIDVRARSSLTTEPPPHVYFEGLWGFLLTELPGERTRLVVSGYQTGGPRWLAWFGDYFIYPPIHWTMQTRQFATLARLAERDRADAVPSAGSGAVPSPGPAAGFRANHM